MTESEILELECIVEQGADDIRVQLQWYEETSANLSLELQRLKAAFRFYRFMRNDSKMKGVADDIVHVRKAIDYLASTIGNLKSQLTT